MSNITLAALSLGFFEILILLGTGAIGVGIVVFFIKLYLKVDKISKQKSQ
jgi:hypothetical protein